MDLFVKNMQKLLVGFMLTALVMNSPVFGATSEVYDELNSTHSERDPKMLSILDQMDLEALEQQVAALGLGEGDRVVAVISEEGELLELGALEVQVASGKDAVNAVFAGLILGVASTGFVIMATGGTAFLPLAATVMGVLVIHFIVKDKL